LTAADSRHSVISFMRPAVSGRRQAGGWWWANFLPQAPRTITIGFAGRASIRSVQHRTGSRYGGSNLGNFSVAKFSPTPPPWHGYAIRSIL